VQASCRVRVTVWTLYFIIKSNKDAIFCGTVNKIVNETDHAAFIMLFYVKVLINFIYQNKRNESEGKPRIDGKI
jgi:hypothetical protein